MIGHALIVLWSVTLPNPTSTPQTINAGMAPTNDNYVPVMAVIKGLQLPQVNPNTTFEIDLSNNSGEKSNISKIGFSNNAVYTGTYGASFSALTIGGNEIVSTDQNLYVTYSMSPDPYVGTPITLDILGYLAD